MLAAFAGAQTDRMTPSGGAYQGMNLVGAVALATSAAMTTSWGFLLLNSVWAGIAAMALLRRAPRARVPSGGGR